MALTPVLTSLGGDSNWFSRVLSLLTDAVAYLIKQFFEILFAIQPLRTEGVWPLGRPVSAPLVGPNAGFDGGLLPYIASNAYDKVSVTKPGELLVFSLLIFGVLYMVGGYAKFFDWKLEDNTANRDPVVGVGLILFWFPLYFGFLSLVHEGILLIPIDRDEIALFVLGVAQSAWTFGPVGMLGLKIGGVGMGLIAFIMYVRTLVIGAYLLFGPILAAVAWAEIPKASEISMDLLKTSIPVAVVPIPIYLGMWFLSTMFSLFPVSGLVQLIGGVFIFAVLMWLIVWGMWIVFTRTGRLVDQAGEAVGKVGGATGLYIGGADRKDAQKAARYGPMSVVGREASEKVDEQAAQARTAAGAVKNKLGDFVDPWGEDDGTR